MTAYLNVFHNANECQACLFSPIFSNDHDPTAYLDVLHNANECQAFFFLTNLLQCDPVAAGRSQTNVKIVCCHQSTPM